MLNNIELVRPETVRGQVENVLRQAIVSGRFAPGARLIERELCEILSVSRTSVREALRKLEAEKLVCNVPHKGPVVTVMSRHEAAELYVLRALLEGYAAHEFARLASDKAIVHFGNAVQVLRAQAAAQIQDGVLKAKAALYEIFLDNCGNSHLKEILSSFYSRMGLWRALSLRYLNRLSISLREIGDLYEAFKARDSNKAQEMARRHVLNAEAAAMRIFQRQNDKVTM
ncbi:MAG: GntR family transcriptional regulator [Burkholderiaceae bacterium]|jgi:DNA-binding GntR family transcriptional regulator|nr:GntR family transcriptional regulator [Burkholderiaceae bacterium]